ncbi:MAG: hypothetical protein KAU01_01285 [Candidatus Cloacimonetes bacterium]|nr:hypothetical protein [Candidatus Cloacimonadota bacterium]
MKKVFILSILVLFVGSLLALESDPSEVVGFVKITTQVGFTPFSLPFTFYSGGFQTFALDDIIGAQLTGGAAPFLSDQIHPVEGGAYGWYDNTNWQTLTNFTDGHAYYAYILTGHSANPIYLAGNVEQTPVDFGTMAVGFNPVGIREAGVVSLDNIDILSSGFTGGAAPFLSDQIHPVEGGAYAWHNGTAWQGFTTISPGKAYNIYVLSGHTPFTWIYDPTTRDSGITRPVKSTTTSDDSKIMKTIKSSTIKGTSNKRK